MLCSTTPPISSSGGIQHAADDVEHRGHWIRNVVAVIITILIIEQMGRKKLMLLGTAASPSSMDLQDTCS
jgi:hypothetical protein